MGRLNAGRLRETVTLTLPGAMASDGRGGQRPSGSAGPNYSRAARVRVLRAAERTRAGLTVNQQAWEVTVRAHLPVAADPYRTAHRGRLQWQQETGAVVSVEPDEGREFYILLVVNQVGS